ncbi:HEPN domain-containing protein [Geoalkalibacter halelectricus]|uniref:HEPN domain-containing protein n=1 Tax=Geoalkalibacter halelectricus TaxID=2847045 RepID=A0ABY5ZKM9_9BACT|nr:HEPN domain-containing protein [Geoalkalibacter halelectricus]MDO3379711.1 HEPN domain-containing protein [Geoalkalibacter halelectricus]UWZ79678.1 HEPN domain-containing protein [Geoalkalibacter halelectricus]
MSQREQALLLLRKAREDEDLLVEIFSSARVSDEIFGFHSQQAAEKLLKAMLADFGVDFPRTHNLRLLMDMLADIGFQLPYKLQDLDFLTPYGTLFRYEYLPSDIKVDRKQFLGMVRDLRELVEKRVF